MRQHLSGLKLYVDQINNAPPEQLAALVRLAKEHRYQVAVELGGCLDFAPMDNTAGEWSARHELAKIEKFYAAGGQVDFLDLDGPIRRLMHPENRRDRQRFHSIEKAADELVDALRLHQQAHPKTRFWLLSNFPNWGYQGDVSYHARGPKRQDYGDDDEAVRVVLRKLRAAEIPLAGVTVDNPYDYLMDEHSSVNIKNPKSVNWLQRVRRYEDFAREQGLEFNLIVNSERGGHESDELFHRETLRMVDTYWKAGGRPTRWFVQTWYPYPKQMAPETAPHSMTALVKAVIDRVSGSPAAQSRTELPARSREEEPDRPPAVTAVDSIRKTENGAILAEDFDSPQLDQTRWRVWQQNADLTNVRQGEGRLALSGRGGLGHNGLWGLVTAKYKDVVLVGEMDIRSSGGSGHRLALHLCGGDGARSPDHWVEIDMVDLGEKARFSAMAALPIGLERRQDRFLELPHMPDRGFLCRVSLNSATGLADLDVKTAEGWRAVCAPIELPLRTVHAEIKLHGNQGSPESARTTVSEAWFDQVRIYPRPENHHVGIRLVRPNGGPIWFRENDGWPPKISDPAGRSRSIEDLEVQLWTADGKTMVTSVRSANMGFYLLALKNAPWDVYPVAAQVRVMLDGKLLGQPLRIESRGVDGLYPDDVFDVVIRESSTTRVTSTGAEPPLADRISTRTFPSVFQAWNAAENVDDPSPLHTVARHDLIFHAPEFFGLRWNHQNMGLADGFSPKSIEDARAFRRRLLELNPRLVLLTEIRYRDAPKSYLPEGHPWWLRDAEGRIVSGWEEGGFLCLNFHDPAYRSQVVKQAKAAVDSGAVDGVMLDWWSDDASRLKRNRRPLKNLLQFVRRHFLHAPVGPCFVRCLPSSRRSTDRGTFRVGEPIRNFGMGGYGVYQAFRRMVREERTDHAAEYLIFYIWGDDHIRSLLRCRHAAIYRWWDHQGGRMFHNNFWPNLEFDLQTGRFVEKENLLPTRESLYQMTDPQWMAEHLKDDLALELFAFKQGLIRDLGRKRIDPLAVRLGFSVNWDQPSTLRTQAGELLDRYSLQATRFVLEKAREFARQNHKKLLVVLFDPYRAMAEMRRSASRYDQEIVDYLVREQFDYFDMNEVHLRDFKKFNLPYEEYLNQYFIGHYSPRGNHFFAYSIKDTCGVLRCSAEPEIRRCWNESRTPDMGLFENVRFFQEVSRIA